MQYNVNIFYLPKIIVFEDTLLHSWIALYRISADFVFTFQGRKQQIRKR
jgi:hypothetical protein